MILPFQHFIVQVALSRSGPYLVKAITAIASLGVAKLAIFIPNIDHYITQPVLVGAIWCIIDSAVNSLPSSIIKEYGKSIQETLNEAGANLKVDGVILSKTANATSILIKK